MATTRAEYMTRMAELAESVRCEIMQSAAILADSGVIDFRSWDSNYILPRHAITAILRNRADYWQMPYASKDGGDETVARFQGFI